MAKLITGIAIFIFLAAYDYFDFDVKYLVFAVLFAIAFAFAALFDSVSGLIEQDEEL